jgi:hypothetical protein
LTRCHKSKWNYNKFNKHCLGKTFGSVFVKKKNRIKMYFEGQILRANFKPKRNKDTQSTWNIKLFSETDTLKVSWKKTKQLNNSGLALKEQIIKIEFSEFQRIQL